MSNTGNETSGLRVLVADVSLLWRRAWHAAAAEELNFATMKTIGAIRRAASGFDRVVLALDCPPYKRKAAHPSYKEGREPLSEAGKEQFRQTVAALEAEGYLALGAEGHEADDVGATVCKWSVCGDTIDIPSGHNVTLYTSDKDWMSLVSASVHVLSPSTGDLLGPKEVCAKFGVEPSQVPELLALMGDKSDNVAGVKDCGKIKAAKLLADFSSLGQLYEAVLTDASGLSPALLSNVRDAFRGWPTKGTLATALELVTLCDTVPIDCDAILAEQHPKDTPEEEDAMANDYTDEIPDAEPTAPSQPAPHAPDSAPETAAPAPSIPEAEVAPVTPRSAPAPAAMVVAEKAPIAEVEWDMALEPRNQVEAIRLCKIAFASRLFHAYGKPEAVMMVIQSGRELGLRFMASLRAHHIVEGKPTLSAQGMLAICMRQPDCVYFRPLPTSDDKVARVEILRKAWPKSVTWEYTADMAKVAGLTNKNVWKKYPRAMLLNRCIAEAARFYFADVCAGLYDPEEMEA